MDHFAYSAASSGPYISDPMFFPFVVIQSLFFGCRLEFLQLMSSLFIVSSIILSIFLFFVSFLFLFFRLICLLDFFVADLVSPTIAQRFFLSLLIIYSDSS